MVSFRFPFYKICVLEDSDIGGPSSVTVRMEYSFAFGGARQKVSFLFFFSGVT